MSGTPPGCGEDFSLVLYDEHAAVLTVYASDWCSAGTMIRGRPSCCAVGPAPRVRAEVSMAARDGGTGRHLTLAGPPEHGWCSRVARAADGSTEIAATWSANGFGRVDVTGVLPFPPRS